MTNRPRIQAYASDEYDEARANQHKKKAPAATGAISNRTPNHYEGETMNTTVPHTAVIHEGILAWVTELAEIRERVLNDRITSIDDPRAQQIIDSDHYPHKDGGEHLVQFLDDEDRFLEELVWSHFTPKPELPRAAFNPPAWATTVEAEYGMWPEIPVYFVNSIDMGILDVRLTYVETVFAERVDDRDGTVWLPGEVSVGEEPELVIHDGWTEIRLGPERFNVLHQLSAAINRLDVQLKQAERPLTRHTEPGNPAFEATL